VQHYRQHRTFQRSLCWWQHVIVSLSVEALTNCLSKNILSFIAVQYNTTQYFMSFVGTVDNPGNTEIMETVIVVKCCECHHFAKMPCFCQNAVVLCFQKNILFLISIIWSLLCEFNTKIFTFPMPLLPKSVCFVTYWQNMWLVSSS